MLAGSWPQSCWGPAPSPGLSERSLAAEKCLSAELGVWVYPLWPQGLCSSLSLSHTHTHMHTHAPIPQGGRRSHTPLPEYETDFDIHRSGSGHLNCTSALCWTLAPKIFWVPGPNQADWAAGSPETEMSLEGAGRWVHGRCHQHRASVCYAQNTAGPPRVLKVTPRGREEELHGGECKSHEPN